MTPQLDLLAPASIGPDFGETARSPLGAADQPTVPTEPPADAARTRALCLAALAEIGPAGGTADEVAGRLGLPVLTVRPRCTELRQLGLVERTGERRATASGSGAYVLRVAA